ncbi:MAG: nucleoside triphosphate pyrophosphohydrolase family protein [Lachnospiraceae bacterium]|jgi:NTP pyrophosphatase (non-canonical NTP hydrolase)|nr:nucleoside triphosphate pyrophosphohydrolase family protein [Lachnospiraceae bacterium]
MTVNEYQDLAMRTLSPKLEKKDVLINSVMGLCGESGEVIDIVKKWVAQGHSLDKEHLAEELGDVAWYLAEAATALDLSLEAIFRGNIEKLKKRYPDGFDCARSVARSSGEDGENS